MTQRRIVVLILCMFAGLASAGTVDLTGQWLLTGSDTGYPHFEWTADLYLVQGSDTGGGICRLSGSFYWHGTDGDLPGEMFGWEDFRVDESYVDLTAMTFHAEGYQLRDLSSTVSGDNICLGIYNAIVGSDGDHLLNGTWNGTPASSAVPGNWTVVRVPEPSVLALTALGLLPMSKRRARRHC